MIECEKDDFISRLNPNSSVVVPGFMERSLESAQLAALFSSYAWDIFAKMRIQIMMWCLTVL